MYVGDGGSLCAVLRDRTGAVVASKRDIAALGLTRIAIQPQVAPLERNEKLRDRSYVRGALDSIRAPLHFRNQLRYLGSHYFDGFRQTVEQSWPGLTVSKPELRAGQLQMLVRNEDFAGEVAQMGHGLQMWLQLMWFLSRAEADPTVILDEPDVYMHADLQRKLIKLLRGRHEQVIMATHSVEIIGEVEPDDIIVVNARDRQSLPAASGVEVQRIVDELGGTQKLALTRLWRGRRCMYVEGKDAEILRRLHASLFPRSDAFDAGAIFQLEGWGGWKYVPKLSEFIRTSVGTDLRQYCVLDSDYFWPDEIQERHDEASRIGVELQVWPAKEIENYLVVASAIERILARQAHDRPYPSTSEIQVKIDQLTRRLKRKVVDGFADSYDGRKSRAVAASTARKKAEEYIRKLLGSQDLVELVPGKDGLLGGLARWTEDKYAIGLSTSGLARELRVDEMHRDIVHVLEAFEKRTAFTR